VNYLSQLEDLQVLKLKIKHDTLFKNEEDLKRIIEQVEKFKSLKYLKLYLSASSDPKKNNLFTNIVSYLKNVLTKESPIEVLCLESNQIEGSATFLELLSYIELKAEHYKKIRVSITEYEPKKADLIKIARLVEKLRNIRVLKFSNLNVSSDNLPKELINSVSNLKFLRKLVFGEISGTLTRRPFIKVMEDIRLNKGNCRHLKLNNTKWKFD